MKWVHDLIEPLQGRSGTYTLPSAPLAPAIIDLFKRCKTDMRTTMPRAGSKPTTSHGMTMVRQLNVLTKSFHICHIFDVIQPKLFTALSNGTKFIINSDTR
jgi:hypothetical protein